MGRHPQRALTARTVNAFTSSGKARRIADGGGLYLVSSASGAKSWVLRTIVKGRRCDIGVGSVSLVTLADARDEAQRLRKIARAGGDPLAERRRERRGIPTFEAAARQVHAAHAAGFKNTKHQKQWLSSLSGAFAAFGGRPVDTIGSADVLSVLSAAWSERPETSRRVLQRIRVIFDWCRAQGFCEDENPTTGLTKVLPRHRPTKAHHPALPFNQVASFIQRLRNATASESVRLAFELTILCATRTSETLKATWSEFDLEAETWTIPANRMKANVEHRVPLSRRAIEILKRAQKLSDGSTYVFHGSSLKQPLSNMAFLMALRRMKCDGITPHGFRSTFRDWAAERTNVPRAVCEAALAHTLRDKTEAAYNRTDLFERRRDLMALWGVFATAKPAKVVALRA
jgi:integrase